MNNYNIVLYPPKKLETYFISLARDNFAEFAYDYLLEKGKSFPHITLCQFKMENYPSNDFFGEIEKFSKDYEVNFRGLYMDSRIIDDKVLFYSGISVLREENLHNLHNEICNLIDSKDDMVVDMSMKGNDYFPHVTLARIEAKKNNFPTIKIDNDLWQTSFSGWKIAVGRSDKIYQYKGHV